MLLFVYVGADAPMSGRGGGAGWGPRRLFPQISRLTFPWLLVPRALTRNRPAKASTVLAPAAKSLITQPLGQSLLPTASFHSVEHFHPVPDFNGKWILSFGALMKSFTPHCLHHFIIHEPQQIPPPHQAFRVLGSPLRSCRGAPGGCSWPIMVGFDR